MSSLFKRNSGSQTMTDIFEDEECPKKCNGCQSLFQQKNKRYKCTHKNVNMGFKVYY